MKRRYLIVTIIFFVTLKGFSQAVMPENLRAANTVDRLGTFHGNNIPDLLYGIPFPPGKVIGDTYLSVEWKTSTILLYDGKMIEGYPTRYDIHMDELELNAKNGIKVLAGNKVKSFVWIHEVTKEPGYFINAKEFKNGDNIPLRGFFQVLVDGTVPLFKRTIVSVKKADFNPVLNVGSHDDTILKKNELYYASKGQVFRTPSTKKKVLLLFGEKSADVEKFINKNALSITKEEDLVKMFEYYNISVNRVN
jgi:hypothetical protein